MQGHRWLEHIPADTRQTSGYSVEVTLHSNHIYTHWQFRVTNDLINLNPLELWDVTRGPEENPRRRTCHGYTVHPLKTKCYIAYRTAVCMVLQINLKISLSKFSGEPIYSETVFMEAYKKSPNLDHHWLLPLSHSVFIFKYRSVFSFALRLEAHQIRLLLNINTNM